MEAAPPRRARVIVLSLIGAAAACAQLGCGPPCRRIAAARDALRAGRPAVEAPHARVVVPHTLANRLIADAVQRTGPVPVRLPMLGPLAPTPGALRLAVKRARLIQASGDRLGLALELELRDAETVLVAMAVRAVPRARIERSGDGRQHLVLGLDAGGIRALRPEIAPDAVRRLAELLHGKLPAGLRRLTPRVAVEAVASKIVAWLGTAGFDLLRGPLLGRLGQLGQLRVQLPDLPLRRVRLAAAGAGEHPALVLDLFTGLPVRAGIDPGAGPETPAADALQVRASGSFVAELANWAMDRGLIPTRYDKQLRPKQEGGFRPHFDWRRRQQRPLKVHVFRTRQPCAHLVVGARAEVAVKQQKLQVTIVEREVERVEGPPLVKLSAWLDSLLSSAVTTTNERAATMTVSRGGHRMRVQIRRARLTRRELILSLAIEVTPPSRGGSG